MSRNIFNDVLFAVTREDHKIEEQIIKKHRINKMLTICSGGCVPLSLKTLFPNLYIMALDINHHQIEHVKKKSKAARHSDLAALNIGQQDDSCLNQSGKFEKMFQSLRNVFCERVSQINKVKTFFDKNCTNQRRAKILNSWLEHVNIREPFEHVFNDSAIEKVFSDKATKHGEKGTYADYFYKKIIFGLNQSSAFDNPFLQHVFLGYYNSSLVFPYMKNNHRTNIDYFLGSIFDIDSIRKFDFVNLSNLFDWSDSDIVFHCIKRLSTLKEKSVVLLRQLNNNQNWYPYFSDNFYEDTSFDLYWQKYDRSLFYDHFRLFIKK